MPKYTIPLLAFAAPLAAAPTAPQDVLLKKLTPVIYVDEVEPCLGFWVDRLGFEKTMEVPHEGRIGFAAVARGGVEIMYQGRASLAADNPALGEGAYERSGGAFFVEVESLDEILTRLGGGGGSGSGA